MSGPFDGMSYDDVLALLRQDLQLDATTDILNGTILEALTKDPVPDGYLFQPGDLKLSAVPTAPTGWLLCDGSAVSRTTYAALYAALGGASSAWGQGDGTTTFNVPDLRGRVPVGAGTGTVTGAVARVLGTRPTTGAGGEEGHVQSVAEMPSHNHGGTTGTDSPDHNHNVPVSGASIGTTAADGTNTASGSVTTAGANQRHAHSIPAQGGGGAFNIRQPEAVTNFFVKT